MPSGQAYRDIVLPSVSRQLETEISAEYFAIQRGSIRLIILDYLNLSPSSRQAQWLESELGRMRSGERLLIFAHGPIFPVARPFFTERDFALTLTNLLQHRRVDAFFCGHAHNNCVSLHRIASRRILQVKIFPLGFPDQPLVPLDQTRALMLPDWMGTFSYLWGYLEDSCPAWVLVEAGGEAVRMTWHRLGGDEQGVVEWKEPGEIEVLKRPPAPPRLDTNFQSDVGLADVKDEDMGRDAAAKTRWRSWDQQLVSSQG